MDDQASVHSINNPHIPLSSSVLQASHNGMTGAMNQTMNNNSQFQMNDQILGGNNMELQPENMLQNISSQTGDDYEALEDFPLDALAFNQGLAAYATLDSDNKGQKLKEARLMEALDRQTSLLESIGQSYKKNKEIRQKTEMRKLKKRLEKLENQKLFRELETQQAHIANDIAQQNNQLIFSHMNAQAQLKANPLVISMNSAPEMSAGLNPLLLHATLQTLSRTNQHSKLNQFNSLTNLRAPMPISHPLLMPGMHPQRAPLVPGPFGNIPMGPGLNRPPFMGPMPYGHLPPFGLPMNKNQFRLPPIEKAKRKQSKYTEVSFEEPHSKGKKGIDVDEYLNNVLDKHKKSVRSKR